MCRKNAQVKENLIKAFSCKRSGCDKHARISQRKNEKIRDILDILREYFPIRLAKYAERKQHMLSLLRKELKQLNNKLRFLNLVVSGTFSFRGRQKSQLMEELSRLNFDLVKGSYDYLLNQPLWNLTTEKIQTLAQQQRSRQQQVSKLESMSPNQL